MHWTHLAQRQAGVITRVKLCESGLSRHQISRLVSQESLLRIHPGVYCHRSMPVGEAQRLWAAALWSNGVISHRSAARWWQLPLPQQRDFDVVTVTVPDRGHRRSADGVRVRRLHLGPHEVISLDGLALTGRSRTIIDLLRTERFSVAVSLLDRSLQLGWVTETTLHSALAQQPSSHGNVALRRLLAQIEPGADAESERILHRLLRRAKITGWQAQCRVRLPHSSAYLDVGFREKKLGIEVDGRRHHDELSDRFESDQTRQNALIAQGWMILRFTWRRLNDDPTAVIQEIRAALELAGQSSA